MGWVRNGHALDWPRHSGGRYNAFQLAAQDDGVGIWIGDFETPWDWRAQQGQPVLEITEEEAPAAERSFTLITGNDCRIKGNIAANGERIYHLPTQKYYTQTTINRLAGERWFCSEAEARKAGWRRSKV